MQIQRNMSANLVIAVLSLQESHYFSVQGMYDSLYRAVLLVMNNRISLPKRQNAVPSDQPV